MPAAVEGKKREQIGQGHQPDERVEGPLRDFVFVEPGRREVEDEIADPAQGVGGQEQRVE